MLVVLVAPGDTVELSPRIEVGADGSVACEFAPVETGDGVAVTEVDRPTPYRSPGLYRVLRDGAVVESRPVPVSSGSEYVGDPPVPAPLDPAGEEPVAETVDLALQGALAQAGVTQEQVRLDLLFSGPLPE